MSRPPCWDARCSEILRRMAGHCHDHEIAASIEAETGKQVTSRTVADYRRAGDLLPCRRNDWSAPLKCGALPRAASRCDGDLWGCRPGAAATMGSSK